MAQTTFDHSAGTISRPNFFSRALDGVARFMEYYMQARDRSEQVRRLQAKSDAELARMGLTREGIVSHVFRDVMWL
ncbi:hypothetical protein [Tranquillimonas rosea]|nr:hypothetical protein [Tranquillimonas rosea]